MTIPTTSGWYWRRERTNTSSAWWAAELVRVDMDYVHQDKITPFIFATLWSYPISMIDKPGLFEYSAMVVDPFEAAENAGIPSEYLSPERGIGLRAHAIADHFRHGRQPYITAEMIAVLVELDEKVGYELAMLDEIGTDKLHTKCGYVVAGIRNDGKFNKWSKSVGPATGGYSIHEHLEDAQRVLNVISPDVRVYFRIFPVVLTAGDSPVAPKDTAHASDL